MQRERMDTVGLLIRRDATFSFGEKVMCNQVLQQCLFDGDLSWSEGSYQLAQGTPLSY